MMVELVTFQISSGIKVYSSVAGVVAIGSLVASAQFSYECHHQWAKTCESPFIMASFACKAIRINCCFKTFIEEEAS